MKKLTVHTENPYEIIIEAGISGHCGEIIRKIISAEKVAVITDSNVAPLYLERVSDSLRKGGFNVFCHVFPAGEGSKNLEVVAKMLSFLAECSFTRSDAVVALGGGVTGDMAGFAASIYMRGIDFVQIPTTLLAQIDSSVGGKTGVNLSAGKNLCGAFHQPRAVIIDPETLKTLPRRVYSDGMAEALKYGCILDRELFERIADKSIGISELIFRCISLKRQVVEADERESGERMLLNFGHTAGHALEKHYGYSKLTHGEAVAVGMVTAALYGEREGLTAGGTADRIKSALDNYSLPFSDSAPASELAPIMLSDKKRGGDCINTVLLHEIGRSFIKKLPVSSAQAFLKGWAQN